MLRAIPLLSALALLLSSPSQAALLSAAPASLPPAASENASTAFLNDGSESRIGLLCHNDPVNRSDPTGLEDENYFDNGFLGIGREPLRKWITRSSDDSRTFTIGAHGVEGGRTMWDANRKIEMTPRQLFDRTKNSPELHKAERVMLYSCELGAGGKNSFAQQYANLTGKTVMAPTKELWVDKKGNYFSAGTLPKVDPNNRNEALRPDYSDMGKIQIFQPKFR